MYWAARKSLTRSSGVSRRRRPALYQQQKKRNSLIRFSKRECTITGATSSRFADHRPRPVNLAKNFTNDGFAEVSKMLMCFSCVVPSVTHSLSSSPVSKNGCTVSVGFVHRSLSWAHQTTRRRTSVSHMKVTVSQTELGPRTTWNVPHSLETAERMGEISCFNVQWKQLCVVVNPHNNHHTTETGCAMDCLK